MHTKKHQLANRKHNSRRRLRACPKRVPIRITDIWLYLYINTRRICQRLYIYIYIYIRAASARDYIYIYNYILSLPLYIYIYIYIYISRASGIQGVQIPKRMYNRMVNNSPSIICVYMLLWCTYDNLKLPTEKQITTCSNMTSKLSVTPPWWARKQHQLFHFISFHRAFGTQSDYTTKSRIQSELANACNNSTHRCEMSVSVGCSGTVPAKRPKRTA